MIVNSAAINAEIDYARTKLRARREDMRRIVDGMAGRTRINQGSISATRLIENHYHQYASLVVPRMCSGDPRVRVSTPRANQAKIAALAGEAYVNEWIRQTQHRILAQRLATDAVLGWGGALLHLDRRSGFDDDDDDPKAWPILTRLDQSDFWFDTIATSWQGKKYAGYDYGQDKNELIARGDKEEGWYKGTLRNLPTDIDEQDSDRPQDAPRRGEVRVRECWLSGFRLPNAPKNTNGTVFTLAVTGGAGGSAFIRAPRPFFGPPWGPLYLYDIYYVPGQALGMSPCEAVAAQVDEVNRHAEALSASTAARKKIGVANLLNRDDAELIRTTPEGGLALITGGTMSIKDIFGQLELAGATPEQRQALAELIERLERNSALDDAGRGRADSNVTATATATANETQGIRTGYVSQRFSDCDAEPLRGVLWYVIHHRALRMHIKPEDLGITPEFLKGKGMAPDAINQVEVEVRGGPDNGLSFEDYTLTLDRFSMERVSEGLMQQRALQLTALVQQIAATAPQTASFTDLRGLLDRLGDAFNVPDLGQILDPEKAAQLGGQMAMASMSQKPDAEYSQPSAQMAGPKAGQRASSAYGAQAA